MREVLRVNRPSSELQPHKQPSGAIATGTVRTPTYVQVVVGKLAVPSGDSNADGRDLVRQCLDQIEHERFPPQLFILWATPDFKPYEELLTGIRDELTADLRTVPLIGTSAAAVWFDQKVHEHGVVLTCLASKWIEAKVAVAENAQDEPAEAVKRLLDDLRGAPNTDINPRGNRYLMTCLPG